jgi:acyl carrier protein
MSMIGIERIKEVLSAVIDVPIEQISDNASMDDIESWDSLAQMNLVIALEDEFQLTIPDEEVGTLISIQLILSLVNEIVD